MLCINATLFCKKTTDGDFCYFFATSWLYISTVFIVCALCRNPEEMTLALVAAAKNTKNAMVWRQ